MRTIPVWKRHFVLTCATGCLAIGLVPGTTAAQDRPPAGNKSLDFSHDVVPVLKKHCIACHGGKESKGGFSLNTRALILDAEAATPGDAKGSRVIELVSSPDPDNRMPPKGRVALSVPEVAVLRTWIDQGLKWEPGFTFAERRYEPPLLPRKPELPPAIDGRTNPVDRILDAYLASHGVPRPPPVDDATFLRRLHLDVIGLLPSPDQRRAFLAEPTPDKRSREVHAVLGRAADYAEHWLAFWNDLLRNDYVGTGYIDGGRKQISGWLYQALLAKKPYDQFVRELIAPAPEAEGFIQGIKWRGTVNASQTREIQFAQNVTQVFLGINLKCASCHDSFIDHWKLEEAYNLAAVYSTQPLEVHRCDKPTGKTAQAAWLFPELGQVNPQAPQPERLQQLAALMTHPHNGRLTRTIVNRLWHRLMGRGIVHPVDAMHTEPWHADLIDYLAVHLVEQGYDLKQTIALIVTSAAYQSQTVAEAEEPSGTQYTYRGPSARRMTAEQFVDAVWQITGTAPARIESPIQRAVPAARPVDAQGSGSNRQLVRASLVHSDLLMRSLGRPNREQVVTTRPTVLTTLEALDLANGQILASTLRRGAAQLSSRHSGAPDELVDGLYVYALSRVPTAEERAVARELLGTPPSQHGVEDLLWAVFMLPEFQLVR